MHVGRVMHTGLVTISPDASLLAAQELIDEHQISHLLVVDKSEKLLGIVSDRDLKQSWASPATTLSRHELNYLLDKITVDMIMVRKLRTVAPETTIERAALIMKENRISALPVKDGDTLVGIITRTDVLGVLLNAIGIEQDSFRLSVVVRDRIGCIAEMTQALQAEGINVRSLFSWPETKLPGVYQLFVRVAAKDGQRAVTVLEKAGFQVLTTFVADITPYLSS